MSPSLATEKVAAVSKTEQVNVFIGSGDVDLGSNDGVFIPASGEEELLHPREFARRVLESRACPRPFLTSSTDWSSLSTELLDHDDLLTPILRQHFGEVRMEATKVVETEETYMRASSLRQNTSNRKILDATLIVMKRTLPTTLIDDLRSTSKMFGQLLLDYGTEVIVRDRRPIILYDQTAQDVRIGRQHRITDATTQETLCLVNELLVPEQNLLLLKSNFEPREQVY